MKVKDAEAWLAAKGCREVTSPSKKYRKFVADGRMYWLGKSGAVRVGERSSDSFSISDMVEADVKVARARNAREAAAAKEA